MEHIFKNRFGRLATAAVVAVALSVAAQPARADQPPPDKFKESIPVQKEEAKAVVPAGCEGYGARAQLGGSVWFFDEENTLFGPGAYMDFYHCSTPLNLRVGIEGRHMYLGQDAADFAREFTDKTTRVTYLRIPFALEYVMPLSGEDTMLFLGGGPDIIHTANDLEDTNVGMHIGARVLQNFDEHWGAALEVGYMWGDVDGEGEDVELNGAYLTPALSYTF